MATKASDTWFEALQDFGDWWLFATEYANCNGDYELPAGFYSLNQRVCEFIRTTAQRDVTPFAEIGNLVKRHAGIVTLDPDFPRSPDPHASISDLHNAIWRALPSRGEYLEFLRVGESDGKPIPSRERPSWDSDRGELSFRGQVIRKVSGQAANIRKVLDAFHELNWPARIDDPLPGGKNQARVNDTCGRLNDNLRALRFFGDGSGAGFAWEVAE